MSVLIPLLFLRLPGWSHDGQLIIAFRWWIWRLISFSVLTVPYISSQMNFEHSASLRVWAQARWAAAVMWRFGRLGTVEDPGVRGWPPPASGRPPLLAVPAALPHLWLFHLWLPRGFAGNSMLLWYGSHRFCRVKCRVLVGGSFSIPVLQTSCVLSQVIRLPFPRQTEGNPSDLKSHCSSDVLGEKRVRLVAQEEAVSARGCRL